MLKNKPGLLLLLCLTFLNVVHAQDYLANRNHQTSDTPLSRLTTDCTGATISSVLPLSGPANTVIAIIGSGFSGGTTSVKLNNTTAAFTVVSNTLLKATVPVAATSGNIEVTTTGCSVIAGTFTVLASDCNTLGASDIYISELYDHVPGSYGVIELYNPTNNTITFNGNYVLERYGDVGDGTPSYTLILPGSIDPESTYLVLSYGSGVLGCSVTTNALMGTGINENDQFKLRKNKVVIDDARAPNNAGYTVIRQPDAIAPSTSYGAADWTFTSQTCSNLGNHNADPAATGAVITSQPVNKSACINGTATFTVGVTPATGAAYQWKMLNNLGIWVNVPNGTPYSGATTAQLTINPTTAALNGTQYRCEIVFASCELISNAAQLNVTVVAVAATTVIQPTCTIPTGTITITSPITAGLTYSIDGTNFQTGTIFATLAPGSYSITVKNADGCTSVTNPILINAVPNAPAVADVTITQPTCAIPTGTIAVTSPITAGLTYSIDGTTFQTGTAFANLAPGSYTITVKNADGCTSVTSPIIVNSLPNAPAVAGVTITQPTCAIPTGTIAVTSPITAGLTYSIDGTTFQSQPVFANLAPGSYSITVKNADGCTSITTPIIINSVPNAPAVANTTIVQPTCTIPTGTITVISPTTTGLTYSIDGTTFQTGTIFANLAPGSYTITVKNADGCTSVTSPIIVNSIPNAPPVANTTIVQPTCAISTGTITVTSPTTAGITYSIDGTTFQTGTAFANLAPGSYAITVKNADGCTSVTGAIVINAVPNAPVFSGTQGCTPTISGTSYILTAESVTSAFDPSMASYQWTINGSPAGYDESTFNVTSYVASNNIPVSAFPLQVIVTVTTAAGCETSVPFTVESSFCSIPKGISPNNDSLNDTFDLTGLNVRTISIINRYGKEVFSRANYSNEWGGQANNGDELPSGTYYYVIELTDGKSETGWVYINREET